MWSSLFIFSWLDASSIYALSRVPDSSASSMIGVRGPGAVRSSTDGSNVAGREEEQDEGMPNTSSLGRARQGTSDSGHQVALDHNSDPVVPPPTEFPFPERGAPEVPIPRPPPPWRRDALGVNRKQGAELRPVPTSIISDSNADGSQSVPTSRGLQLATKRLVSPVSGGRRTPPGSGTTSTTASSPVSTRPVFGEDVCTTSPSHSVAAAGRCDDATNGEAEGAVAEWATVGRAYSPRSVLAEVPSALRLRPIAEDGNCLFSAVADQLAAREVARNTSGSRGRHPSSAFLSAQTHDAGKSMAKSVGPEQDHTASSVRAAVAGRVRERHSTSIVPLASIAESLLSVTNWADPNEPGTLAEFEQWWDEHQQSLPPDPDGKSGGAPTFLQDVECVLTRAVCVAVAAGATSLVDPAEQAERQHADREQRVREIYAAWIGTEGVWGGSLEVLVLAELYGPVEVWTPKTRFGPGPGGWVRREGEHGRYVYLHPEKWFRR